MIVRVILIKFSPDNLRSVTDAMRNVLFEISFLLAGLTLKIKAMDTQPSGAPYPILLFVFCCCSNESISSGKLTSPSILKAISMMALTFTDLMSASCSLFVRCFVMAFI